MDKDVLEINSLVNTLKNRWKFIALFTGICVIISIIFSFFIAKPKYETEIKVFIGKQNTMDAKDVKTISSYGSADVMVYQKLMKTYGELVTTRDLVKKSLVSIGEKATPQQVSSVLAGLSVNSNTGTQILDITYKNADKSTIVPTINSITNEFKVEAKKLLPDGNIQVIETAQVPTVPVSPNKKLDIVIGFGVGIIVSLGIVLLLDYLDNKVREKSELEKILGIPVIGVIPEAE